MITAAIGARTIVPIILIVVIIALIAALSRKKIRDRDG
jgi:hypothetical protein